MNSIVSGRFGRPVERCVNGRLFLGNCVGVRCNGIMNGTIGAICVLSLIAYTDIMKRTLAMIYFFGLVVSIATAATLTEQVSSVDTILKVTTNSIANEAYQLGEILRVLARELAEDDELGAQNEEYFIRVMWEKVKVAVSNATDTVKGVVQGAYDEATNRITKATNNVKQKLREKAAEILSKLITKAIVGYAFEDSESRTDFVKILCEDVDRAGQRLIRQSEALRNAGI
ncbi:uncharacterized protein [Dermacentor albipictus]|uniref:uncharacterized protein n=1 Tax=Dermacentor albipictus TaxID=60249 RepID=UPI0038FC726C